MKIVTRNEESAVAILELEGPLTIAANTDCITDTLHELLRLGVARIVMNMDGVNYLDCAGIGKLLEFREQVVSAGGCLKLAALQPKQHILLDLFRLTPVLGVCDSERSAVASFFQPLESFAPASQRGVFSFLPARGVHAVTISGRNTTFPTEPLRTGGQWCRG